MLSQKKTRILNASAILSFNYFKDATRIQKPTRILYPSAFLTLPDIKYLFIFRMLSEAKSQPVSGFLPVREWRGKEKGKARYKEKSFISKTFTVKV